MAGGSIDRYLLAEKAGSEGVWDWDLRLLITHIVESEGGAENDIGQARHPAP